MDFILAFNQSSFYSFPSVKLASSTIPTNIPVHTPYRSTSSFYVIGYRPFSGPVRPEKTGIHFNKQSPCTGFFDSGGRCRSCTIQRDNNAHKQHQQYNPVFAIDQERYNSSSNSNSNIYDDNNKNDEDNQENKKPRDHEQQQEQVKLSAAKANARKEAEKLTLLAEKVRLEAEKAQIEADRRRIELDAIKRRNQEEAAKRKKKNQFVSPYQSDDPSEETDKTTIAIDSTSTNRNNNDNDNFINVTAPKDGNAKFTKIDHDTMLKLLDLPHLDESDITLFREKILKSDIFEVSEEQKSAYNDRIVYRGKLLCSASQAYNLLEQRIKENSFEKKIKVFVIKDPATEDKDKPVVVVIPNIDALQQEQPAFTKIFVLALAIATTLTMYYYGVQASLSVRDLASSVALEPLALSNLPNAVPIALGAFSISLFHELAHRITAKLRKVRLGLPVFLPSLQIGTYGSITPINSIPRTRSHFFDIAVSGPLIGMLASLTALITGLALTSILTMDSADAVAGLPSLLVPNFFPQIPSAIFRTSLLVGSLANALLPSSYLQSAFVAVHPLTVIGYTGMISSALNLIPIGALDGGRIVNSLFGRITGSRISNVALLLQSIGGIVGNNPLLILWGLFVIFFQREGDILCHEEITEPDNFRTIVGLSLMILMVLTLTPFPGALYEIAGQLFQIFQQ